MPKRGMVSTGWALAVRHHRILWWMFFVNLVLAWLASLPFRVAIGRVLNNSLAADKLVKQFDIATMLELISRPEVPVGALSAASLAPSLIFLVYVLFITGGIISVYREDRKLSKAEFFEHSGGYFWRMVRLALLSLIPFGILAGCLAAVHAWSNRLSDNAVSDKMGFWVLLVFGFVIALSMLFVRAWFDLSEARTVALNERGMFRNCLHSLGLALRGFSHLLGTYFVTTLAGGVVVAACLWLWLRIPHQDTIGAFVMLEIALLARFFVRLWQKAACITYYERNIRESLPAPVVMPQPLPQPVENS